MAGFAIHDASTWQLWQGVAFASAVMGGTEILARAIPAVLKDRTEKIEIRGKHLDVLANKDLACIAFNKLLTIIFVYHTIRVVFSIEEIEWDMSKVSALNVLPAVASFYVFYDLIYTGMHFCMHHRSVYHLIHKHHHQQKAPSRGFYDAINVHPVEFCLGEYLHLLTVFVISKYVLPVHVVAVALFIGLGGIFASLNHTRFDVNIPGFYQVKNHDVHHRLPESNYGQYIMLWDVIFGSYRPYTENLKATEKATGKATGKAA